VIDDEISDFAGLRSPDNAVTPRLYRNRGDGTFEDVTSEVGLAVSLSSMGANFGDLDSDGFVDFYHGTCNPSFSAVVPNRLFRNIGGKRFEDVTFSANVGHLQKGHGVAFCDFDRDGDNDMLSSMGGDGEADRFQGSLFRNPGNGNHWLEVLLIGTKSNRSALGARVGAQLPGGRWVYRTVASGGPFGNSPLRQRLGLGQADRITRLEVLWPNGTREIFENLAVDRYIVIQEGRGTIAEGVTSARRPVT